MICQRFPTPAGRVFRKALPDWNLLLRVGLDLGSERGLSQLQRGAYNAIQLHKTTPTTMVLHLHRKGLFINSQQYSSGLLGPTWGRRPLKSNRVLNFTRQGKSSLFSYIACFVTDTMKPPNAPAGPAFKLPHNRLSISSQWSKAPWSRLVGARQILKWGTAWCSGWQRRICLDSKVMDSKATAWLCFNKLFVVARSACHGAGSLSAGNTFAFLYN